MRVRHQKVIYHNERLLKTPGSAKKKSFTSAHTALAHTSGVHPAAPPDFAPSLASGVRSEPRAD